MMTFWTSVETIMLLWLLFDNFLDKLGLLLFHNLVTLLTTEPASGEIHRAHFLPPQLHLFVFYVCLNALLSCRLFVAIARQLFITFVR